MRDNRSAYMGPLDHDVHKDIWFFMDTQGSEFCLDRNSGFPYGLLLVSLLNLTVPIPTRRASIPSLLR